MSHRMLQVNENIQRELSPLLIELNDWGNALVTISQVMVTPDLRTALIWISVLNDDKPERIIDLLNKRSSEFYRPLSDRLKMQRTPVLEFRLDDKTEELTRIDSLIDEINQ